MLVGLFMCVVLHSLSGSFFAGLSKANSADLDVEQLLSTCREALLL